MLYNFEIYRSLCLIFVFKTNIAFDLKHGKRNIIFSLLACAIWGSLFWFSFQSLMWLLRRSLECLESGKGNLCKRDGINSNAIDNFKCWVNFFKVDLWGKAEIWRSPGSEGHHIAQNFSISLRVKEDDTGPEMAGIIVSDKRWMFFLSKTLSVSPSVLCNNTVNYNFRGVMSGSS